MTTSTKFWGVIVRTDWHSPVKIDLDEYSVLHITKAIHLGKEDVILYMRDTPLCTTEGSSEAAIVRFDCKNPEAAFDIKINGNATRAVSFYVDSPGNKYGPPGVSICGTITTTK
jgi:hypothetical protein